MSRAELTEEQRERVVDFVTALRSGSYEQTRKRLVRDTCGSKTYCCEGVAVERYGSALGYELWWDASPDAPSESLLWVRDLNSTYVARSFAPPQLWVDMGLASVVEPDNFRFTLPDGLTPRNPDHASRLTYYDLNDDGFTFKHIADMIEWQFLSGTEVSDDANE